MHAIPQIEPHPFREPLMRKLHLWQIRRMLGGAPNEGTINRYLNGIWPMPKELEKKLHTLVKQVQEGDDASATS